MSLITGEDLDATRFFVLGCGHPQPRASSFDLTIGRIFDSRGKEILEPYALEPGHMVQVVSAEIFNLPPNVTGHVTYKTTLTKKGIWALTVGIVDPGWAGPLTTSLLNFSKVDYVISPGAAFLRVSFFQHHAVHDKYIEAKVNLEDYISDAREKAATRLPKTFLNTDKIVEQASNVILGRIVNYAMIWIGVISFFFAVSEFMKNIDTQAETKQSLSDYSQLQKRIDSLQYQIIRLSGNKMTH